MLPLIPVWLLWLLGPILAGLFGWIIKKMFEEDARIVFLEGSTGAGKDTILCVIDNKSLPNEHIATATIEKVETEINDKDYVVYNTPGSTSAARAKQGLREGVLQKEEKLRKNTLDLYIFDMQNFQSEFAKIEAAKDEAKDRGFRFMSIGTHLDKIDSDTKRNIESKMGDIPFHAFNLLEQSRGKIVKIIEAQFNF